MVQENESCPVCTAMRVALGACCVAVCIFGFGKLAGVLDPLVARRGVGAMMGLILVVTGNFLPKLHFFQPATGTLYSDKVDRFAGRIFVLSGLCFATIFLFAPVGQIMTAAPIVALLGFLAVFAGWLNWSALQVGHLAPYFTNGRLTLALMLVAIFGVCGIFLADAIWGDAASRPLGILSPFAAIIFARRLRRSLPPQRCGGG